MPQCLRSGTLILCMTFTAPLAYAIDNPDAPDEVAAFEQRAKPFEERFNNQTNTSGINQAGADYAKFLDEELNSAYQRLLKKLDTPNAREQLRKSQHAWLAYYQAETNFIWTNWTPANFGSSSALSRQQYRNSLLKERVEVLLHYLRNY
jgi:uncharacterized protein YecT (DUF1311 family)